MKAMILAAGRGKRLAPLTDTIPKPLIAVAGKALIDYHIESLVRAGISEIIINTGYLGHRIRESVGDGKRFGCDIVYSVEPHEAPLETAGGIKQALRLLGGSGDPFLVVNADILTDYPFERFNDLLPSFSEHHLAHCICIPNPTHHVQGDFGVENNILMLADSENRTYTFSGIACYHPRFFDQLSLGVSALAPLLRQQAQEKKISAEVFDGLWLDVGTIERLEIASRVMLSR